MGQGSQRSVIIGPNQRRSGINEYLTAKRGTPLQLVVVGRMDVYGPQGLLFTC